MDLGGRGRGHCKIGDTDAVAWSQAQGSDTSVGETLWVDKSWRAAVGAFGARTGSGSIPVPISWLVQEQAGLGECALTWGP